MSSGEISTWYSVKSDTQPLILATSKGISSITGQYFSTIECLPSNRSNVAVNPKINLYFTLVNIALNDAADAL